MSARRSVSIFGRFSQHTPLAARCLQAERTKLVPSVSVRLLTSTYPCFCSEASGVVKHESRPDRLYEKVQIELRAHQPDVLKSYSW